MASHCCFSSCISLSLKPLRWLKTSAAWWNFEGFWQHQWEHTSRASSCRLSSCQQFPFTPAISSAAHRLNFAAYHSVPWDLDYFFPLSHFFFSLSPPSIWSTSEHLPRVSGNPGSGRCLCGCNFYPAQLWDLIRAHTSAHEWVDATTCIFLITTRDVIRIIRVMTTRRIGSCAQSQPKSPTDFGNAWI